MSSILRVDVKNFKGIESLSIELSGRTDCPVTTLIGLNESGKTTVLEALSHFISGNKAVANLFDGVHAKSSGAGLIPLHKKAAFTDVIRIIATLQLDERDIERARQIAKTHKLLLDEEALRRPFMVRREFRFEDSVYKPSPQIWDFDCSVRTPKAPKFKRYVQPAAKDGKANLWRELVDCFEDYIPQISYFPTFLVDMPGKIYLSAHEDETSINRYYRLVFQDILDSLGEGLDLEKHVAARINNFKASKDAGWFALFYAGTEKSLIDSVFQKISNAITTQVLGSWQRVFQRPISAKNIFVEWHIDTRKGDLPYASLYVTDGESRYAISERSLGFRWFFSFLLFTAFKRSTGRSTIFIFDEPAANLHAKAQAELLTSFGRIASEGNRVIYSTHSHHMINPQWLSGAYIVENSAVDYDGKDSFSLSAKPTDIRLTKYREFVSKFPTRSSYFQPVIEKLEYVAPEIIGEEPFVLVEGVSDYYAMKLVQRIGKIKLPFNLMPGVGAGASGPQISLLMGRGDRFLLLLDDDKEGRKQAIRYRETWFLSESSVATLGGIDQEFAGLQLEGLIFPGTLNMIKERFEVQGTPTKKQIGWYLAESYGSDDCGTTLCAETVGAISRLLKNVAKQFK